MGLENLHFSYLTHKLEKNKNEKRDDMFYAFA